MPTIGFHSHFHLFTRLLNALITEQRLITMSVSLCTQTGLHNLTIQVLNAELTSVDTQYNFLTSETLHKII